MKVERFGLCSVKIYKGYRNIILFDFRLWFTDFFLVESILSSRPFEKYNCILPWNITAKAAFNVIVIRQ